MPKVDMNLVDYLRVIRKRKRVIIVAFIFVLASTIYYTSKQTRVYSTSCKVKIDQRKSVAAILTEMITFSPGDEMASQAQIINSYQTMEKVAELLGHVNPSTAPADRMAIVKGLQGRVQTAQIENTNIITITTTSTDPKEATILADTVAEVYVNSHFENKKKEASNVRDFVKAQLDIYLKELQDGEFALQKFRLENPLITDSGLTTAPLQADPLVTSLKGEIVKMELELISLKSKYTNDHPDVIALKQRLEKAKGDLANTVSQFTENQRDLSAKEVELLHLKRDISTANDLYTMFHKKYEEARILEAEKARDVTIIEPASVPTGAIKPNIQFNILIGIVAGLLLGLVIAFVVESMDISIGRIDEIEEEFRVPVLGIIPSTSLGKRRGIFRRRSKDNKHRSEEDAIQKRLATIFDPTSVVAEAYKSLRTHLGMVGPKKNGNSFIITSSGPQEGKTQTLCNLAVTIAQSGKKVLMVDSDFRKPQVHKIFGLKRTPGLTDVLIGSVPWKDAVNGSTDILLGGIAFEKILSTPGIENLSIMTCGHRIPNPSELLSIPEMSALIQELKQNFDTVLFDSPPTLPVTDSSILGALVDGVILVYQAGRTSKQALLRTKLQLENAKAKIVGIVINNLKAEFIEDITPYQKYRYYGYYGEKKK
jgi:capsular exopolysaccharide synthesis family protein